jgi:hypothetical protein
MLRSTTVDTYFMCDCYMTLAVTQHSAFCQPMLGGLLNNKLISVYRVGDKFLARPGRKQATATEYFEFHIIIIIIGIQSLGWSGQRPELSQVTSMALVRCILGKFLGVVCHCFPPEFHISYF